MTKFELLAKINELLFNQLLPGKLRGDIETRLREIENNENDLQELYDALKDKIDSLEEVNSFIQKVADAAPAVGIDPVAVIKNDASLHPFYDLRLSGVIELIQKHLIQYLKQGVDLRDELELYVQSQNQILRDDGLSTNIEVHERKEIFEKVATAIRDNNETLLSGGKDWAIKNIISRYDNTYPIMQGNRAGYKQTEYIATLKLDSGVERIVREVIALYDYVVFSNTLVLETAKSIEELLNESLSDEAFVRIRRDTPSSMKQPGPALVFDREDEEEVDKHREKSTAKTELLEHRLRAYADEVIAKNNLSFKDESNRKRFVNLFVSRLKDVRSAVETRETLGKPQAIGGLGIPPEKIDQVARIIEQAKSEFGDKHRAPQTTGYEQVQNQQTVAPKQEPETESALTAVVPPAASLPLPNDAAPAEGVASIAPAQPELPVPAKARVSFQPEEAADLPAPKRSAVAAEPKVIKTIPYAEMVRRRPEQEIRRPTPRPTMKDVVAPPKTIGPLEELKELTLTDFRRLAPSTGEALAKVKQKIDLIGEVSVSRRYEAIRAWQASNLMQAYLRLGRESIEQGKNVGITIAEKQKLGEPTLTEAEFNAIADFNAGLRF